MILEIAGEEFSRNGYDRTTLDEIAKRCAITKPAIYYHFKDKFTLYEAILCSRFEALNRRIVAETGQEDPRKSVESYIRIFGGFLLENPGFSAIFARELADGARALPENCIRRLAGIVGRLAEILREGERQGIFGPENPFMIQLMIVSTLTTYQTTAELRERVMPLMGETSPAACPRLGDILPNLTRKILKALTC
jgi:AcrR family transcriptional regulator